MKKSILLFIFSLTFLSGTSTVSALSDEHQKMVADLVQQNPGQLSIAEYSAVAEAVVRRAPCNMLVFGVGRDSRLWIDLNKNGYTVFLEDSATWLDIAKKRAPDLNAYLVKYNTQKKNWKKMLKSSNKKKLLLELPKELADVNWDIIFVDGPTGYKNSGPGRMKSIFTAALLAFAHDNVDVFVHDCDRIVEQAYSDAFLLPSNLKETIEKLRHYHIKT